MVRTAYYPTPFDTPSPAFVFSVNNNKKKKKVSLPKSPTRRRQFEERLLAKLFEGEKENKSRLEYSNYYSTGDTDIYVEAVLRPIKGKAH